ncbi:hypothetical protein [Thiosulfativibrio zosterae]|uniref:Uncharacterized protein n=1 Tax=Thiosulfativibrio zosterae TaxID=2675053 RepID=A0A6F8PME8_9GAMM|nr:hypothetical protein [Thiosulfativibrio zosterae]BBP43248.1 hypothetical protein THMIRHAT_09940 [Thiosulfativibrio zosterae]
MKSVLTKLFAPILNLFETGDLPENYRPSHRTFLKILGSLFLMLAGVAVYFGFRTNEMAALLPAFIFAAIGFISLIVAFLGSDKAVSNIWRNR